MRGHTLRRHSLTAKLRAAVAIRPISARRHHPLRRHAKTALRWIHSALSHLRGHTLRRHSLSAKLRAAVIIIALISVILLAIAVIVSPIRRRTAKAKTARKCLTGNDRIETSQFLLGLARHRIADQLRRFIHLRADTIHLTDRFIEFLHVLQVDALELRHIEYSCQKQLVSAHAAV